ncbi:hypothetical protein BT67DRAFT_462465 [Trichocladium antarcticum]|uniref:Peptidase family M20/M25/M40 protein n=1 Tax=Trichocladium antarcticum TaxID=1450529 RepID=A0AAN6ZDV8_9PEZI|nr:hypothetical protein BT67DRAFT_462465 [Trichocladium antarcticum]
MSDPPDPASPGPTLDLSQLQGSQLRRARPPNPVALEGEPNRVPLRPEAGDRAHRRESRLGLRSIFGRHRGTSDAGKGPVSPREAPQRPGGIRASLAEINWPYGLHPGQGNRSEISLPPSKPPPVSQSLKQKKSASAMRAQPAADGLAAWNSPPLFQAYPQAIKHAHLPACTASAAVVLRLHHHKNSGSIGSILNQATPEIPEESASEKGDKPKRRHRRNASGSAPDFKWTTKIFVLATSGYLLQYAGDGPFDRLPEKVLQLGRESAAFASDVIPGRHWVLQVSSMEEPDRTPVSHTSLRARFPFRGPEKRHSSTLLMVFENADDMDSWIATLRQEIEALGGRKVLSETGKPKIDGQAQQLRNQSSQRTLVVRDPDRFSRAVSPDQPWSRNLGMSSPDPHQPELPPDDMAREQSFDDTSTASVISHDGRQLDALRDSTNRFSFMSSGQRTGITSAGSSPACSPIRDSFIDLESLTPQLPQLDEHPQPRLRPNAMAIIDRRQSLQTINQVFEMRLASVQTPRPLSTYSNSSQPEAAIVPYSASKRYSFGRPTPPAPSGISSPSVLGRMSSRRPPPSALSINSRPLSLVMDQPSPVFSPICRVGARTDNPGSPLSATRIMSPASPSSPLRAELEDQSICNLNMLAQKTALNGPLDRDLEELNTASLNRASIFDPQPFTRPHDIPRSMSSLDTYGGTSLPAQAPANRGGRTRGISFTQQQQQQQAPTRPFSPRDLPRRPRAPSLKSMPRSSQHLRADAHPQATPQRRSMSHLVEGPPPAPPPCKALPPIPQKSPRASIAPPPGFI